MLFQAKNASLVNLDTLVKTMVQAQLLSLLVQSVIGVQNMIKLQELRMIPKNAQFTLTPLSKNYSLLKCVLIAQPVTIVTPLLFRNISFTHVIQDISAFQML